jgi:hypothetical protein
MTSRRPTVQEAAAVLGTSVDAVRMLAGRGSMESDKDPDGRVYVWVDGNSSETKHVLDGKSTALISEMRGRIAFLERELEARREEIQRRDMIILNMSEAMKALPSPASQETPRELPGAARSPARSPARSTRCWRPSGGRRAPRGAPRLLV